MVAKLLTRLVAIVALATGATAAWAETTTQDGHGGPVWVPLQG